MAGWKVTNLADAPVDDALDQFVSIVGESLQTFDAAVWETYFDRVERENVRLVWDRQRCCGGLAYYSMGQWYGGRIVPAAGISAVGVDPAVRGSGAAHSLLVAVLEELHSQRMPLASLYASTQQLYRKVGFEHSGHRFQYALPMASLQARPEAREYPAERTLNPDLQVLERLASERGAKNNGNIHRTSGLWQRILHPKDTTTSTYLLGPAEARTGYVVLHHGRYVAGRPLPLTAGDWVAIGPLALQRLMRLILDHRSVCDQFCWFGGPQDELLLAAAEQRYQVQQVERTLSRIVCLPEAIRARGFPPHQQCELHFDITDSQLVDNQGTWMFQIADGRGQALPGGTGAIQCDIGTLATLYCGLASCSQLRDAGRISSTDTHQVQLADAAFMGPAPWTAEMF